MDQGHWSRAGGKVTVVSKWVMADTKQGDADLFMDSKGHVTDNEAEPEEGTLAMIVGAYDHEDFEEPHETEQSALQMSTFGPKFF